MVEVKFEADANRAAAYDGEKLVGQCHYSVIAGKWDMDHTEVDESYGGQGIARMLVQTVIEQAQQKGVKIIPTCSYVSKWMSKHLEYQNLMYDALND